METNSSTSPSSRKQGIALLLALLLTLPAAWIYTLTLNPEIRFWKAAFDSKQEWAASHRWTGKPLTVFSGGSTTSFQIDSGLLLEEFGVPSVNAGFHAGMGLDGTVALATTFLQKGDRLVLMTEPSMLAGGGGSLTALGGQMVMASGRGHDAFFQSRLDHPDSFDFLSQCRPGLYHSATMLGKLLARRPAYRYSVDDLHPGGLISTAVRDKSIASAPTPLHTPTLSPRGRSFLRELQHWTAERSIELVYLLPVSYVSADRIHQQRAANRRFLKEISALIPVWEDSYAGALENPEDFADTILHMTNQAAKLRTRDLGRTCFSQ